MGFEIGDNRSGVRSQLGAEAIGIGFQWEHVAVVSDNFVFVDRAFAGFREEEFPNAA
jgi:hypothetical protein